MNKRGRVGNIIGGFIAILVGASLVGPISNLANNAASNYSSSNLTSSYDESAISLLKSIPSFFIAAVVLIGLTMIVPSIINVFRQNKSEYSEINESSESKELSESKDSSNRPKISAQVTTRSKDKTESATIKKKVIRSGITYKGGDGYNVDQYALDDVESTKLVDEHNFIKSKYD